MAWYAVYRQADGALVSIGQVVAPDADLTAAGLAVSGPLSFDPRQPQYRWNAATLAFDTVPIPRPPISVEKFIDRFSDTEMGAIIDARDNGADQAVSTAIKGFFERLYMRSEVDLDSQRVIDGLTFLEAQGLIAPGRAAEIRA